MQRILHPDLMAIGHAFGARTARPYSGDPNVELVMLSPAREALDEGWGVLSG